MRNSSAVNAKRLVALILSFILFTAVFVWDIQSSFAEEPLADSPSASPTETAEPEPTELPFETPLPTELPVPPETVLPEISGDIPELPEDIQLPDSAIEPAGMMEPCATSGDYDYADNGDGTVTITGYHGAGGDITIPSILDGKTVIMIGGKAFQNNKDLNKVVIAEGIVKIGSWAFDGCYLRSVSFPNSVEEIDEFAFINCDSMLSVQLPEQLINIEAGAFYACDKLFHVIIPEGVKNIGAIAFGWCKKLTSVKIPKSVTHIDNSAFAETGMVKALFLGDAPTVGGGSHELYGAKGIFDNCASDFTVCYAESALGFANPWNGYTAKAINPNEVYSLSFDTRGGNAVAAVSGGFDSVIENLPLATHTGYEFAGWYPTPECNTEALKSPFTITGNTTVYAKWRPLRYIIQYVESGDSGLPDESIEYGTVINNPPIPVKQNYIFIGWYPTNAYNTAPISFPYTVTQNVAFYGKWQKIGPYMADITLSAGHLSNTFDLYKYKYSIFLGENESSVTLSPRILSGLSMTINGKAMPSTTVSLANGKSQTVTIKVKYGKKTNTYKFTVTRAKSGDNNLAALNNSTGTLSQPFDPNVTDYTLSLDENTSSVMLKAAKSNAMASVSPASKKLTLKNGQTKVLKFTVKAQSGAKKTYTVTVTRAPSTNTNLKTLKASSPLSPGFNAGVTDYTVTLPVDKAAVTISAKAFDKLSKVTINGAKKSSLKVTLANGQSTTVSVVVTSQAGTTKEYRILVQRQ